MKKSPCWITDSPHPFPWGSFAVKADPKPCPLSSGVWYDQILKTKIKFYNFLSQLSQIPVCDCSSVGETQILFLDCLRSERGFQIRAVFLLPSPARHIVDQSLKCGCRTTAKTCYRVTRAIILHIFYLISFQLCLRRSNWCIYLGLLSLLWFFSTDIEDKISTCGFIEFPMILF